MKKVAVKINVPEEMANYLITADNKTEIERNALILYPYIKDFTISCGRAAEILGLRKLDLIDLYADLGLSYFDMNISEIDEDMATYESLVQEA